MIIKVARWVVQNVREAPQDVIDANYTFYSHVGNRLSLWRNTSPTQFWDS